MAEVLQYLKKDMRQDVSFQYFIILPAVSAEMCEVLSSMDSVPDKLPSFEKRSGYDRRHRHKLVFWRDFTSEPEILSVWEEEKHNYEVSRTVVCGLSGNLRLALDRISRFAGWILAIPLGSTVLGVQVNEKTLEDVTAHILSNSANCGILRITSPSSMTFTLVNQIDIEIVCYQHLPVVLSLTSWMCYKL